MVNMYYECIVNIFNRELFCCKKKNVYNEDFVNFV